MDAEHEHNAIKEEIDLLAGEIAQYRQDMRHDREAIHNDVVLLRNEVNGVYAVIDSLNSTVAEIKDIAETLFRSHPGHPDNLAKQQQPEKKRRWRG